MNGSACQTKRANGMNEKRRKLTGPALAASALLSLASCGSDDAIDPTKLPLPDIVATNAFYYYDELDAAWSFYTEVLGLETVIDYGFAKIMRETVVDTEKFETSEPGIYAVGDINFYLGKKKLSLCGFHEAALAAFAIKQRIEPDKNQFFLAEIKIDVEN